MFISAARRAAKERVSVRHLVKSEQKRLSFAASCREQTHKTPFADRSKTRTGAAVHGDVYLPHLRCVFLVFAEYETRPYLHADLDRNGGVDLKVQYLRRSIWFSSRSLRNIKSGPGAVI